MERNFQLKPEHSLPLMRQKSLRVLYAGTRSSRKRLSEQSPHLHYASGCILPINLVPTKPFTGIASGMVTTAPTFQPEKDNNNNELKQRQHD